MRTLPFLFMLAIPALFACQQKTDQRQIERTAPEKETLTVEVEEKSAERFVSILSNLRIRQTPQREGDIVGKLDYGQFAVYLGEESENKEQIELRGEMKNDTWKKINIQDPITQNEIIGWVYGGGLMKESEVYTRVEGQIFDRKIVKATQREISDILGMFLYHEVFYEGRIRYEKLPDGSYSKEGEFLLKGAREVEISKNYDFLLQIELSGNFQADKPQGIFEKKLEGYENNSLTRINFEEGKCLWSDYTGSGEGIDYKHREENPKECTFDYIEKRLAEVKGWN